MMRRITLAAVAASLLIGCSRSPTDPSSSGPSMLQGQTVNAVDGSAAASLTVQVGSTRAVTTNQEGFFEVEVGNPGTYRAVVRGNGVVQRETTVTAPSSNRTRLSLIPSSFDLAAFDEMFRTANERLQRWVNRPALVVVASVMDYRRGVSEYEATGEQMSDDEVVQMVAHLTEGLALLTGNTYNAFTSVDVERPASGQRVKVTRTGMIVVGRYNGVVSLVNTIGYGQWSELADGTVNGGSMFLDRDFDRGDSRRRLLRIHELGHALGYLHVRTRTSIMNPSIGPEPTDFDRAGAVIAFQRPPGNRSPDVDPSAGAGPGLGVSTGAGMWTTVFCGH
ncbi:MAG TPA: hypothetical protein VLD67_19860 [Vicinamibacterales bacterium]|nr:hypothetical protein [Vicinamibacterales bacterium]